MLGRHQHRPAPFPADREALDQPQDDQADGRPDADRGIGGKQADEHGGEAHHDEAEHQQFLTADAVAEMAEDNAAERPGNEADRIGGEGEQRADERVEAGEEQLVEDERGRRAVEEEIVPLDGRADHAGGHDAAEGGVGFGCHAYSPFGPSRPSRE